MIDTRMIGIFICLVFLLAACGTDQRPLQYEEVRYNPTAINTAYDEEVKNEQLFNFRSFNLAVDYEKDLTYEVFYSHDLNDIVATINDFDQQKVIGEEAFNQLTPHFQEMSFDEDTTKPEIIEEVIEILGLDPSYSKFALEVTYHDGSKKVYNN
ncbi:YusW family protein [Halobacillus yeomjeoni]|uniref:YusW family protein n=1 Tax=Halobacillus yeomjeoni TaxID=311194 RepID=UPI001CD80C43|nr:YusW family protein [Halobacillus yeomjeoni]MCA0983119.1 YusW family protein [Halobacillus yeomjeoni]